MKMSINKSESQITRKIKWIGMNAGIEKKENKKDCAYDNRILVQVMFCS